MKHTSARKAVCKKKRKCERGGDVCRRRKKRGGGEKEKRNTGFVRVCFVVFLFVCNKRATGGQTCWCDFCKKIYKRFSSVLALRR